MTVFVVVPLGEHREVLEEKIKALPTQDVYLLPEASGWLIKFGGTTRELSAAIGIPVGKEQFKDDSPTALVTLLSFYFGFGPTEMWEWARSRTEA